MEQPNTHNTHNTKIQQFPVAKDPFQGIETVSEICKKLMNTPHYSKLGAEGIYAVVSKAHALGVCPLGALNGDMYYVRGRVMMSASLMHRMIRERGHSIIKLEGTEEKCTLRGKRGDTGDVIEVTFAIEEAKRAGLMNKETSAWYSWPQDMLFNRALSRLSRQLFPDCIEGCYVEGEIPEQSQQLEQPPQKTLDVSQVEELELALSDAPDYKARLIKHCKGDLSVIPAKSLPTVWAKIEKEIKERSYLPEEEEGTVVVIDPRNEEKQEKQENEEK